MNEKIFEEYFVRIYEIKLYFYENYKEKIKLDKNECKYILFRIDFYFTEYLLALEIDGKGHTDRKFIFEEKRQKAIEKNLNCESIQINTSKKDYHTDYEANGTKTIISKFKGNTIKKRQHNKRTRRRNKKIKLQLTNQSV